MISRNAPILERPPRDGLPVLMMADQKGKNMKYTIKISGKQYNDNYTYDTQKDGDLFGEIKEIIEEIENGNIDTLELSKN